MEEEESDDSPELPEEVLDEDVAAIFTEVVKKTIETDGGILNNNLLQISRWLREYEGR